MYSGIIAALLIAVIMTAVATLLFAARGPWGSLWSFFLILFLAIWTMSIYVTPMGPVYWGIAWIPLVFFAVILTVLFIAVMPDVKEDTDETIEVREVSGRRSPRVGGFFWTLVVLLIMAIIIGLANPQKAL